MFSPRIYRFASIQSKNIHNSIIKAFIIISEERGAVKVLKEKKNWWWWVKTNFFFLFRKYYTNVFIIYIHKFDNKRLQIEIFFFWLVSLSKQSKARHKHIKAHVRLFLYCAMMMNNPIRFSSLCSPSSLPRRIAPASIIQFSTRV